jgi:birA, biotin-[acetyl-CoA-carboxylase] ligase region
MLRQTDGISYTLTKKSVKNINLRVKVDGSIHVSAAPHVPLERIDAFVSSKKEWLQKSRSAPSPVPYAKDICLQVFIPVFERFNVLFAPQLKEKPQLKVRFMKTRWGVCHVQKNTIVLNSALMAKPLAAIEYVIAHEHTHFLYPNHQKGFHDFMAKIMPDYKQRRKLLKTDWPPALPNRHIIYENEMTSTNTVLKAAAQSGAPHGSIALCDRQLSGRGRLDRVWDTPDAEGQLTVSLLLRTRVVTPLYTLLAGLCMAKAIEQAGIPAKIKWPNDLVVHGKKVCGILCEAAGGAIIIGTGVNVSGHPAVLDASATHLTAYAPVTRGGLLKNYLAQMDAFLPRFEIEGFSAIKAEYEQRLITLNKSVRIVGQETFNATAVGIDDSGALLIIDESGCTRAISFGDVSVRGVMGYV